MMANDDHDQPIAFPVRPRRPARVGAEDLRHAILLGPEDIRDALLAPRRVARAPLLGPSRGDVPVVQQRPTAPSWATEHRVASGSTSAPERPAIDLSMLDRPPTDTPALVAVEAKRLSLVKRIARYFDL